MEGDVVFANKLKQFNFFGASPPAIDKCAPVPSFFLAQTACYGNVADGRVEPHIEHFIFVAGFGYGDAPFKVAGDGAFPKAVAYPRLGHLYGVVRPKAVLAGGFDPRLEPAFNFGEVDVQVAGRLGRRCGTADGTAGAFQVGGVEELAARFALVAPRLAGTAVGADAPDETVGKKTPALAAIQLLGGLLGNKASLVKFCKYFLRYLGLYRRGSAPEFVKGDVEPAVNAVVDRVVAVAQFAGSYPLFGGACFGGGAVFVGSADVQGLITPQTAKAGERVGGQHLDQVPQVGDVVNIGQRRGDQSAFHAAIVA